jgi:hypothetical protein
VKRLPIADRLRVAAKHRHIPRIPIATARADIQRLAAAGTPTHADQQLVDELEHATGMRIAELAELTKKWLPKG